MIIESPSDPRVQAEVDRSTLAARVSLRPHEWRAGSVLGGHYRAAVVSGLTTVLAANDRILSLRWAQSDRLFVLKRLIVQASVQTVFGTAQENAVDLVKLTGFTAPDTGGTAVVLGGGYKLAPFYGNSEIADLRVSGATALGAGTSTVDSIQGRSALNLANTLGAAAESKLYDHKAGVGSPLTLSPNEGFNVRIAITQGAAGVIRFVFTIEWAEVPVSTIVPG